jgi:hypothetical protein
MEQSLDPTTLILRKSTCFYCNNPSINDAPVAYMFGIRYCIDHTDSATRDCIGWHHAREIYIENVPNYKVFNEHAKNMFIKRSNGDIEDGWSLDTYSFVKNVDNTWIIPVKNEMKGHTKRVPLESLCDINSVEFTAIIKDIIAYLTTVECDCVFCKEYREVRQTCSTTIIGETPGVETLVLKDGRVCRTFTGQ